MFFNKVYLIQINKDLFILLKKIQKWKKLVTVLKTVKNNFFKLVIMFSY